MSDLLLTLANTPVSSGLVKKLGLPAPVRLKRSQNGYQKNDLEGRRVLILPAEPSARRTRLRKLVNDGGAIIHEDSASLADARLDSVIYDATVVRTDAEYRQLYEDIHGLLPRLATHARLLFLTISPTTASDVSQAAYARGMSGFVKSVAKEIGRRGATANLIYMEPDTDARLAMPVRYFCSDHSAFVSGQSLTLSNRTKASPSRKETGLLEGKTALVTGAAGGIGAATARRLAQEGARVICLDIPAAEESLNAVADDIEGVALPLDITRQEAANEIAEVISRHGGTLDVLVHNAGITRDRSLAKMSEQEWDMVVNVNLQSIIRIDDRLLSGSLLSSEARVICLSSISGIAGNFGQANYAATKAALIGYCDARARELSSQGITYNAIAPGFIETAMTAAMPVLTREAGRRLNALSQGGIPEDVAEAICFFSTPGVSGINGQTLRVCGLGLMGT